VATGGKCTSPEIGSNKPKPLPPVATSCRSERKNRRGSTSRFAPGRCDPFAARETASRAHPTLFANTGNDSSRADPAGGSRKLPQVPANPRNGSAGKPCTRRKSPPIPAQAGSAMTGLSRRRSRVRVPSLPSRRLPCKWAYCVVSLGSETTIPGQQTGSSLILRHDGKCLQIGGLRCLVHTPSLELRSRPTVTPCRAGRRFKEVAR
jgi:hypothetical protein